MTDVNKQNILFKTIPTEIDYFELKEEYFNIPDAIVEKVIVDLEPGTFLSERTEFKQNHISKIETIVLNFQVGSGKSNLFYSLITEYSKKDCLVIVCSPYKKLVSKDYNYLSAKLNTLTPNLGDMKLGNLAWVCNYFDVFEQASDTNVPVEEYANKFPVHIMTINCFLGNPGKIAFEQNFYKSDYIKDLQEVGEEKNVILFIDEIHDSIHNFQTEYFPRLLKWKNKIKKIYIASATYTPQVIPAINLLSLLTEKRITIYESQRVKSLKQANINLNILSKPYDRYYREIINVVKEKIETQANQKHIVNVITATKGLAEEIATKCFEEKNIINDIKNIRTIPDVDFINLLTADTEMDYQKDQSNIGTTFKTGVDIVDDQSLLMIIFPCITNKNTTYGIFSNGISSIIQSIGRLRNAGNIELFIYEPKHEIASSYACLVDKPDWNTTAETHNPLNGEYQLANALYYELLETIKNEVHEIENSLQIAPSVDNVKPAKELFGFWYPNFHEFLLRDRRSSFLTQKASFGKDISSYILWACLNDQFLNAELKTISYYKKKEHILTISETSFANEFNILVEENKNDLRNCSFREVINNPDRFFKNKKEGAELFFQCENEKSRLRLDTLIHRKPFYAREFLNAVLSFYGGKDLKIEKRRYLNACLKESANTDLKNPLADAYSELQLLKDEYLKVIGEVAIAKDDNFYLPAKFTVDGSFKQRALKVLMEIKEKDSVVKLKGVSLMQGNINSDVPRLLKEIFLEVSDTRKSINKKVHYQFSWPNTTATDTDAIVGGLLG